MGGEGLSLLSWGRRSTVLMGGLVSSPPAQTWALETGGVSKAARWRLLKLSWAVAPTPRWQMEKPGLRTGEELPQVAEQDSHPEPLSRPVPERRTVQANGPAAPLGAVRVRRVQLRAHGECGPSLDAQLYSLHGLQGRPGGS